LTADGEAARLVAAPLAGEPDVGADVRAAGLVCGGVFGWWPMAAVRPDIEAFGLGRAAS
jgi:hypothetical protein